MDTENEKPVCTMEYYSVIKSETSHLSKMDGTGGYYVKSKKPDTERQVLCVLHHLWK